MKALFLCEESQALTKAFRARGHKAFSCDLLLCSGGHPEWHKQADALAVADSESWDFIFAFPPCDHLAVSGARWFKEKRKDGRQQVVKGGIENPVGIMSTLFRTPDQIIHPWQFGHPEQKATCLWLKNLPLLKPTRNVKNQMMKRPKHKREREREREDFLHAAVGRPCTSAFPYIPRYCTGDGETVGLRNRKG